MIVFFALAVFWLFVTIFGHLTWVLVAAIFRAIIGSEPPPPPTLERREDLSAARRVIARLVGEKMIAPAEANKLNQKIDELASPTPYVAPLGNHSLAPEAVNTAPQPAAPQPAAPQLTVPQHPVPQHPVPQHPVPQHPVPQHPIPQPDTAKHAPNATPPKTAVPSARAPQPDLYPQPDQHALPDLGTRAETEPTPSAPVSLSSSNDQTSEALHGTVQKHCTANRPTLRSLRRPTPSLHLHQIPLRWQWTIGSHHPKPR